MAAGSVETLATSIELHVDNETTEASGLTSDGAEEEEETKTEQAVIPTTPSEADVERRRLGVAVEIEADDGLDDDHHKPQSPTTTNLKPINDDPLRSYTLLEDEDELRRPLTMPHKSDCWSVFKYRVESFLVVHPRIYALYLLYRSTWPRGLVLFDVYTDLIVALSLYRGAERIWFMLSCLFIAMPFVLVWSASLRFIQNFLFKLYEAKKESAHLTLMEWAVNVVLILYMFPPLGAMIIALYEVYWVLSDVWLGCKAFVYGTGLVEAEDRQTKAMKSYRRAIEIFAESIPQTLLQLYIFFRIRAQQEASIRIDEDDLYLSLGVSLVNLLINFYNVCSQL